MSKAIGIDLGTTFSAIAELDDLGNPEVLTSIDNNSKITASAVYIGKDNNVIVGDKAKDASVAEPKRVIKEVKREMENDVCYDLKKGKWVPAKDDSDQSYIPSQISSLILKKLKEYTSDVKKIVVTVPALFAEKARSATLDAIKLADMECLELINEPTAAILHYANLPGVSVGGRVLVFDLGGGTFDVTIAKVKDKKVDVITSRGDKYLGGADFDREILKIINKKYKKEKGKEIDVNDKKSLDVCEKMKRILSSKEKAAEMVDGPKGPLKVEVTRAEFEKSINIYLEKIKMLIEDALDAAECESDQISQTLLVGGSTRIPCVTELIKKTMGKPPVKGVNVDEAVASGAAIYAGLLQKDDLNAAQKKALDKVELADVCNHYLGTISVATDQERSVALEVNSIIISRDSKLPCSRTERYTTLYDGQSVIECSVTQSEGKEKDIEFVNVIYKGELKLPENRPAGRPVDVTYSYDKSGVVHCEFLDIESGEKHEVELRPEGSKDVEELKEDLNFVIE